MLHTTIFIATMKSYQNGTTSSSHPPHLTILLAEDDLDDQLLIQEAFALVDPGFKLHLVSDGSEVLEYLQHLRDANLPCLIVLDYNMPRVTGIQVLTELNKHPRYHTIPKVVLSTSNNPKYIKEAEAQGAYAYRVKPHNFERLVEIAKEMMHLCKAA